jgi:hypothetical protein
MSENLCNATYITIKNDKKRNVERLHIPNIQHEQSEIRQHALPTNQIKIKIKLSQAKQFRIS